jgi:HSP20 family protein
MLLQRWNPFVDFRRVEESMDRLWRGVGTEHHHNGYGLRGWRLPVDVAEEDDKLIVRASLPGIDPDDLHVTIEDNVLTIRAETKGEEEREEGRYLVRERRSGSLHRSLLLPETVDGDKAEPTYENGVLTITLPKAETKKAKELKVHVGKALEGGKTKKA